MGAADQHRIRVADPARAPPRTGRRASRCAETLVMVAQAWDAQKLIDGECLGDTPNAPVRLDAEAARRQACVGTAGRASA
jgi:hypothetical protein